MNDHETERLSWTIKGALNAITRILVRGQV